MKRFFVVSAVILSVALAAAAQESLGDAARRLKKEKEQSTTEQAAKQQGKPVRTYTNENMPTSGTLNVVGTPSAPETRPPASESMPASRGRVSYSDAVKQLQQPTEDWVKGQREAAENQKKCAAEGRVWVPKTPSGEGGFCGTMEQRYNAAAQKCRAAGGTWIEGEDRSGTWIEGQCRTATPPQQKKR